MLVVAAVLRFAGLGHPDRLHFDERYYANDARAMVEQGVEEERPAHPPMGKWVLAAGISLLGFDPVGWRLGAAVAGMVVVAATYALVHALLRDRWPAAAAAALVAVDGLAITSSRIALLDGILAAFVAVSALLIVRHQRDAAASTPARGWRPAGWAVWAAGASLGAALSTKWSAAPFLAVAAVAVGWAEARRRSGDRGRSRAVLAGIAAAFVPVVVLPLVVYAGSYAGMLVNYRESQVYAQRCPPRDCPAPVTERVAGIAWHHGDLVRMHRELEHTHPYRSSPASWAVQQRPVLSYLERCPSDEGECVVPDGTTARIVMVGNPALWWTALAAVPVALWQVLRRRSAGGLAVTGLAASLYIPWFAPDSGYLYYLAPLTPFVALAVVVAARTLPGRAGRVAPWVVVGAAVALLAFLAPIWYGWPLGEAGTDARLLLGSWR